MAEAQGVQSRRKTRAAGFILMAAGIIGTIVGLALLVSGQAFGLTAMAGALLGAIVLVFSAIEFVGGVRAYQGKNFYGTIAATILGLVTFFTLPLDLVAAILVILGEEEFES